MWRPVVAERLQISINWKANDENCVRRSFPQVGVDNLDKSAHGCSPLHSLGVLLPAQRCRDGSQTSERVGHVNLPLLIIRATSCVTVRSPPCTSIVGSAARDAPSCTVLWALSQYHSRSHTHTHTHARGVCIHASFQIFSDNCDRLSPDFTATQDSRWETLFLPLLHSTFLSS